MTNALYPAAIDGLLTGAIDLDSAAVKAALIRGYTYDSADITMADVLATGTLNGVSAALSTPTVSGGAFDAADTSVSVSASGSPHSLIMYQSSAVTGGADVATSAQRVIAFMDTGTEMPITPGAGTVNITWDSSADKIFKIG